MTSFDRRSWIVLFAIIPALILAVLALAAVGADMQQHRADRITACQDMAEYTYPVPVCK